MVHKPAAGVSARLLPMKFALIATTLFVSSVSFASVPLCGMGDGNHEETKGAPSAFNSAQKVGTKATCAVSGEAFAITEKTAHSEYKGKHYYFCCPGCKTQFDKNPDKFLSRNS
jgi:YHS domain-containing protein